MNSRIGVREGPKFKIVQAVRFPRAPAVADQACESAAPGHREDGKFLLAISIVSRLVLGVYMVSAGNSDGAEDSVTLTE